MDLWWSLPSLPFSFSDFSIRWLFPHLASFHCFKLTPATLGKTCVLSLVCPNIGDHGLLTLRGNKSNYTYSRQGWDGLGSHSPGVTNFIPSLLRIMAAIEERTFIAIKPDGVQRGLVGEIIKRFEKKGFKLVAMKLIQVSSPQLLCLIFLYQM